MVASSRLVPVLTGLVLVASSGAVRAEPVCLYANPDGEVLHLTVLPCAFAEPPPGERLAGAFATYAAASRAARAAAAGYAAYTLMTMTRSNPPPLAAGGVLGPGAVLSTFGLLALCALLLPWLRSEKTALSRPLLLPEPANRLGIPSEVKKMRHSSVVRFPALPMLLLVLASSVLIVFVLAGCATFRGGAAPPDVVAGRAIVAVEQGDNARALELLEGLVGRVADPALQRALAQALFRLKCRLGMGPAAGAVLNQQGVSR